MKVERINVLLECITGTNDKVIFIPKYKGESCTKGIFTSYQCLMQ